MDAPVIDPGLKEYLDYAVIQPLKNLLQAVNGQAASIRSIEINTTTEITKINGQIDSIWKRIDEIHVEQKERLFTIEKEEAARQASDMTLASQIRNVEESQKFRWNTLAEERKKEADARAKREEDQAVLNQMIRDINTKFDRLTWLVASTIILIVIYGVFELLKRGGP